MSTEDEHQEKPRKRLTFDPTINAGHILTMTVSLITTTAFLVTGWNLMDKRVLVLEQADSYQSKRDDQQDAQMTERLRDIRDTLKELKDGVNEIRRDQQQQNSWSKR